MPITEPSLVIKSARNAAIATDHTLERVFMRAGTATHPKELIDSFSPNFLNAPGMQTTCKWQPSPSIDGIIDGLELWYDLKNGDAANWLTIANHFLSIGFLSCVINSQEVVRYSGEEMSLIYQEYLLRQHAAHDNDEHAIKRALMDLDYNRFRKVVTSSADGVCSGFCFCRLIISFLHSAAHYFRVIVQ